jgi:arylsulfatase A-like enzyme
MYFLLLSLFMGCRDKPDVIILSIDTLRYDHVSSFNEDSPAKTPALDLLAKDGVKYTQAYSPISVTGPAFISLMTGQNITSHNVAMNAFRGGPSLSIKEVTLAERFLSKGYRTSAFVSGFTLHPQLGLYQGFEIYDYPINAARRWGSKTAKLANLWLETVKGSIFLWFHSYDPHGPWEKWGSTCSPEATEEHELEILNKIPQYQRIDKCIDLKEYKRRYATAVQFADYNVGTVIKKLKIQGRYDNALIILTADHGESFTERELWFDHGTTAHEEQLHVPLIIKYPKNKQAGTVDNRLISLLDIAPTVVEAASLEKMPIVHGASLLSSDYKGAEILFGESSHCKLDPSLSCVPKGPLGKQFSIRNTEVTVMLKGKELTEYARKEDPDELQSKHATSPLQEVLNQLAIERRLQVKDLDWPPKRSEQQEMQLLRSLGYISE